jgi:AGCS family alanine or glycine:cation symporter
MLTSLIGTANGFLWGMPMLIVIGAGGIFLTVYLGFPQFKHFGDAWKRILDKGDPTKTGGVSPFASFCTTMAMRVGTGNVAGVAVAVYAGGPGALFWMFVIGITNSCVNFVECTQGSMYKTKIDGEYRGGPYYVAERGLGWKAYGVFIAIISFVGIGLFMPSAATNTVCVTFAAATGVPQIVFAAIIAVAMFITCLGGIKRISDAASAIVPFMVAVYMVCFALVVAFNIGETGRVFSSIFANAFTADGVLGGESSFYALKMDMNGQLYNHNVKPTAVQLELGRVYNVRYEIDRESASDGNAGDGRGTEVYYEAGRGNGMVYSACS